MAKGDNTMNTLNTTTNTNLIKGGNTMNLTSFILETIKEGGCDVVYVKNYTLEEWTSFNRYMREHHVRYALLNREYVKETYIYISDRAIKSFYDIMLDRPHNTEDWKGITKEYNGNYSWDVEEVAFIKAHGNMVRGCGTIVHTLNKSYIK